MIDWYTQFDEINAELQELAARSAAEEDEPEVKLIYIGSGEDFCEQRAKISFDGFLGLASNPVG